MALPPREFAGLVLHLARRELAATHEGTFIGWAWPVFRQLAQLGVLVFVFGSVLDLGIENFAVFVFTGLIAWTWFASGVTAATSSVIANRHLVFQPRLPTIVLPLVAIAVPFVDVLFALPIVIGMLVVTGELSWQIATWPAIMLLQFVLMAGIAWITASTSVYARDIPGLVSVVLTMLFYLTPVFYGLRAVPDEYEWVLNLNPLTTLVTAYRAVMVGEPGPSMSLVGALTLVSIAVAYAGWRIFRRLERGLVDHL